MLANSGARVGDLLVLTKAIGTGVITTALKRGLASEAAVAAATASMLELNREGCAAIREAGAHGATDVTGFGLLGHAREMALASGVTLEIDAGAIPLLEGALEYARAGAQPGGLKSNREFVACDVDRSRVEDDALYALLCDPQTSGGLLASVERANGLTVVGRVVERRTKAIELT